MQQRDAGRRQCLRVLNDEIYKNGLQQTLEFARECIAVYEREGSNADFRKAGWNLELRCFVDRHGKAQTFPLDVPYEKTV